MVGEAEKKCMDMCEEIVDCSKCEDDLCEDVCEELEDRCVSLCLERIS